MKLAGGGGCFSFSSSSKQQGHQPSESNNSWTSEQRTNERAGDINRGCLLGSYDVYYNHRPQDINNRPTTRTALGA
jgi:hypothetical protein